MDEMSNKREERICMLEELLGKTEGADQNIIEILNQYCNNSKRPQQPLVEDEESYLVSHESFLDQKNKLSKVTAANNNQSRLAYSISVVLYVLIVILCAYYLVKNWN